MNTMNAFSEENLQNTSSQKVDTSNEQPFLQQVNKKKIDKNVLMIIFWLIITIIDILVPDPVPFIDEILLIIVDAGILKKAFNGVNSSIRENTGLNVDTECLAQTFTDDLKQNGINRASFQNATKHAATTGAVSVAQQIINDKFNDK